MGKIRDQRTIDPSFSRSRAKLVEPELQNRIQVREDDEPRVRLAADLLRHVEHAREVCPMLKRALAGSLDHRTVGNGIAEGDAQLDDVGASANRPQRHVTRGVEIGIAAGDVGNQAGTILESNRQTFVLQTTKTIHHGERGNHGVIFCFLPSSVNSVSSVVN